MNHSSTRRGFLAAGATGASMLAASSLLGADPLAVTPSQTSGPFYPVPGIEKQKFNDTDLTKKLGDDEVGKGEIIRLDGVIRDTAGKPLNDAVVEIWQACTSGKYNHPRDNNTAELDENFQFWGRMITDESGAYSFLTIKPGKYPGRTPHIHMFVAAPKQPRLVTQMYFAENEKENARDGIYRSLSPAGKKALTVGFEKCEEGAKGKLDLILGAKA
ncbi:MAG: protocatechuate 3,4-dioxygenase [bacterium]|nr:protocatechuate 3,4-dioxygenase [bacterium]